MERTDCGSEKLSRGDQRSQIPRLEPGAISLSVDGGTWSDQFQQRRRYLERSVLVSHPVAGVIRTGAACRTLWLLAENDRGSNSGRTGGGDRERFARSGDGQPAAGFSEMLIVAGAMRVEKVVKLGWGGIAHPSSRSP